MQALIALALLGRSFAAEKGVASSSLFALICDVDAATKEVVEVSRPWGIGILFFPCVS
jgi:hypothetical protein